MGKGRRSAGAAAPPCTTVPAATAPAAAVGASTLMPELDVGPVSCADAAACGSALSGAESLAAKDKAASAPLVSVEPPELEIMDCGRSSEACKAACICGACSDSDGESTPNSTISAWLGVGARPAATLPKGNAASATAPPVMAISVGKSTAPNCASELGNETEPNSGL